jgi:hypothetical protein
MAKQKTWFGCVCDRLNVSNASKNGSNALGFAQYSGGSQFLQRVERIANR